MQHKKICFSKVHSKRKHPMTFHTCMFDSINQKIIHSSTDPLGGRTESEEIQAACQQSHPPVPYASLLHLAVSLKVPILFKLIHGNTLEGFARSASAHLLHSLLYQCIVDLHAPESSWIKACCTSTPKLTSCACWQGLWNTCITSVLLPKAREKKICS